MKKCSLCGKENERVKFIIQTTNPSIFICNYCGHEIFDITNQVESDLKEKTTQIESILEESLLLEIENDLMSHPVQKQSYKDDDIPSPLEIYDFLNKRIVGQEQVKKTLSVAASTHYKRILDGSGILRKNNIMLIGPSGSGKTLLIEELAKVLNVPFVIADATSFTQAGYVGDDVEQILMRLIDDADGDIERAERGIVYIDEIDKIAKKTSGQTAMRDAAGEGVQHSLLKIVEGSDVPIAQNQIGGYKSQITINTENILFVCGGAFVGLDNQNDLQIGFISQDPQLPMLSTDSLIKYGMTAEFVGRFPVICQLNELNKNDIVKIMTEIENSIVTEYQYLFSQYGCKLSFTTQAISAIADIVIKKNIGARGIRSVFELITRDLLFNLNDNCMQINKHYVNNCFS